MAAKHTPGPWIVKGPVGAEHIGGREPVFLVYADRTLNLEVKACSDGFVRGENEANAHLIAAAPDLLAFAQKFLADYMCEDGMDSMKHYAKDAREAIAKALGSAS